MNLNIRNVDTELVRTLKMKALTQGTTLRAYCLSLLGGEQSADAVPSASPVLVRTAPAKTLPVSRSRPESPAPVPAITELRACPTNPEHQGFWREAAGDFWCQTERRAYKP